MNIKELAEQAGFEYSSQWEYWTAYENDLERFAELVAEQTHTNNKAKWYQEGYEAGRHDEREAIIDIVARHGGSVEIEAAIKARKFHD